MSQDLITASNILVSTAEAYATELAIYLISVPKQSELHHYGWAGKIARFAPVFVFALYSLIKNIKIIVSYSKNIVN